MKFEIYCDESHPDVFWSQNPGRASYCLIGSLWLPAEQRKVIKNEIIGLNEMYGFSTEIKWHKAHERFEGYFNSLVDIYLDYNRQDQLRFRCIAIDSDKINLVKFHESDAELGFYKFYYQMLVHWILDFNEYRIFCDEKTNRIGNRLRILRYFLNCSNITSSVVSIQALPSTEVLLLQFTDFLLGMASSRMNNAIREGSTKDRIIRHLENGLGINRLSPTTKGDRRFNIFKINLSGGW
jgi:hypothetical protein